MGDSISNPSYLDEIVWTKDLMQHLKEGLSIWAPCGRKKMKMPNHNRLMGRNELISHYILSKTGKYRSRKQISSKLQVMAKKS